MKYLDEYRDPRVAERLLGAIRRAATRPWTIMEVCGGQTHTLVRSGIDRLVPDGLRLVHGPGCPVCVTPLEQIDRALAIAARPGVIFTSFGDMLRVPGSSTDLLRVRAEGGDVRVVYSPLDAVKIARENPEREVVFFAVGFETTAPATALAAREARRLGLANFSMLVSHVLVPPRWRPSSRPRPTACRASSPPGTSAPSWGSRSIPPSPSVTGSRSSSRGSSRSTCWRAS